MIAPSVVQEVRRLLAREDLSQRKIARITGISRGSVGAIAAGKRSEHEPLRRAAEDEFPVPTGPPRRCPGCGGMVYMPCRLCDTRALKAGSWQGPIPVWLMRLEEPLGLDLRDQDRARYEEIRAQKADALGPETGRAADRIGEAPRSEQGDLCGAFEFEEDELELDDADLRDAFDWDDEELPIDDPRVPAYEDNPLPDFV